ncbi:unnamed protein product [Pleuronectes platessa]|uniref:Uncharacterized protein n=1 Tax=Pleuronectes platessa TaxID=8262 RepID=A0A9N7VQ07_PLEPL|nr:unnamed protein product [Pleuronectes platessa]
MQKLQHKVKLSVMKRMRMKVHPVLRILSLNDPAPHRSSPAPGSGERAVRGRGAGGPRPGGHSPVGGGALVDDVLVGGEQGQSVLAEIHSHVGVRANIQSSADGERHGERRRSEGERGGERERRRRRRQRPHPQSDGS